MSRRLIQIYPPLSALPKLHRAFCLWVLYYRSYGWENLEKLVEEKSEVLTVTRTILLQGYQSLGELRKTVNIVGGSASIAGVDVLEVLDHHLLLVTRLRALYEAGR